MLDIDTARELIRRHRPKRSRDGYPVEVRTQVAELAAGMTDDGRSVSAVADELELSPSTLSRWLGARTSETPVPQRGFMPVSVAPPSAGGGPEGTSAQLRLVSPSGYRLEGLDLDSAIEALRRLG